MAYQSLDEFIQSLPTAEINNARSIVRNLYRKAYRGNYAAQELERLTGIDGDFSAEDVGGERTNEN
jgi:hypothetical protein